MQRKVMRSEAVSQAKAELVADDVDRRFEAMEKEDEIGRLLDALKARRASCRDGRGRGRVAPDRRSPQRVANFARGASRQLTPAVSRINSTDRSSSRIRLNRESIDMVAAN